VPPWDRDRVKARKNVSTRQMMNDRIPEADQIVIFSGSIERDGRNAPNERRGGRPSSKE